MRRPGGERPENVPQAFSEALADAQKARELLDDVIEEFEWCLRHPDSLTREEAEENVANLRTEVQILKGKLERMTEDRDAWQQRAKTYEADRDHWMARAGDIFENFEQTRRATA